MHQEEIKPLDADQARTFLNAAKVDPLEALYVVSLTSGLRIGKALGLRWSDINLDAGTLRVSRQLQHMRRLDDKPGTLEFAEPKNASRRTVGLPTRAVGALQRHAERQAREIEAAGDGYDHAGLVFANRTGGPLDAQNVVNRDFRPLLKRAGLPGIRFHDLRHTCATLLLAKGVHPKLVQVLLGHASISMTMDLYSHWAPAMGDQTATAMDAILYEEDRNGGEGDSDAA